MDIDRYYYPVFIFEGKEPRGLIRKAIIDAYVDAYGKFVDSVNPMYETWNKEYEKLGLPNDGFGEDDKINPDSIYNQYIREKHEPYTRQLTNKNRSRFIKRYFSGKECEFRAELYDGTELHFVRKPVRDLCK
jgi:hypothetical protein